MLRLDMSWNLRPQSVSGSIGCSLHTQRDVVECAALPLPSRYRNARATALGLLLAAFYHEAVRRRGQSATTPLGDR